MRAVIGIAQDLRDEIALQPVIRRGRQADHMRAARLRPEEALQHRGMVRAMIDHKEIFIAKQMAMPDEPWIEADVLVPLHDDTGNAHTTFLFLKSPAQFRREPVVVNDNMRKI
jgi:hypothetical protein